MRSVLLAPLLALACLVGCQPAASPSGISRLELPSSAVETQPKERRVVRGQKLYVPCYSHVYLLDGKPYNLAITLSLRNTSPEHTLILRSVVYYDSDGQRLKELSPGEIELAPLSVAEIFVHEQEKLGGSGASFLVDWVAEAEISDPVVEAVMVGSAGALGVSFLTSSRVLQELPAETSAAPTPSPTPGR